MNRSVPVIPSATAPWATDMIPRICAVLPEIQALFTASTFSRKHFLGYLPDGDPTVITKGTSTLEAIEAALSITETGGGGAVLSYYGHPGGAEEKAAVEEFLHNLPPKYFSVMKIDSFNRKNTPPVLYLIKKLKDNRKI